MKDHERLVNDAKAALTAVHEDDSVDLETTVESLEDIRDGLDELIELTQDDLKRKPKKSGAV